MVSSYLTGPLRTLEQALDDRARPAGPSAGLPAGPPAGPQVTGLGPVELLVRLLTDPTNQDGATEASAPALAPALAPAAAGQRSPLDRYRAA